MAHAGTYGTIFGDERRSARGLDARTEMLHGSIIERFAEVACNVGSTSSATRGWDALLIDQLRYDFRRFQKGIRIQELAPPEEIPIAV